MLRPPQFGLRSLLALLTICGLVFALTQWLPPLTVLGIAFLLCSIAAHVAGNAIGRYLGRDLPPQPDVAMNEDRWHAKKEAFAPATRLGQHRSLGWPLFAATMAGFIAGGIGGGYWVILSSARPPEELSIVVGIVAYSILGGIFSFVAFGFLHVGASAIRQTFQAVPRANPTHRQTTVDATQPRP